MVLMLRFGRLDYCRIAVSYSMLGLNCDRRLMTLPAIMNTPSPV